MADAVNGTRALEKMSAVELRSFARENGLPITYLQQRKRDDLLKRVQKALRERAAAESRG